MEASITLNARFFTQPVTIICSSMIGQSFEYGHDLNLGVVQVLYLTEPIDEPALNNISEFKRLQVCGRHPRGPGPWRCC